LDSYYPSVFTVALTSTWRHCLLQMLLLAEAASMITIIRHSIREVQEFVVKSCLLTGEYDKMQQELAQAQMKARLVLQVHKDRT